MSFPPVAANNLDYDDISTLAGSVASISLAGHGSHYSQEGGSATESASRGRAGEAFPQDEEDDDDVVGDLGYSPPSAVRMTPVERRASVVLSRAPKSHEEATKERAIKERQRRASVMKRRNMSNLQGQLDSAKQARESDVALAAAAQ